MPLHQDSRVHRINQLKITIKKLLISTMILLDLLPVIYTIKILLHFNISFLVKLYTQYVYIYIYIYIYSEDDEEDEDNEEVNEEIEEEEEESTDEENER